VEDLYIANLALVLAPFPPKALGTEISLTVDPTQSVETSEMVDHKPGRRWIPHRDGRDQSQLILSPVDMA
jgi:hypothetical protein